MKTKNILCFLFLSIGLHACGGVEMIYSAKYTYMNECSEEITVKSYSPKVINGETVPGKDSIFMIPQGGSYSVRFSAMEKVPRPLNWLINKTYNKDSTIVIMNNKQIVYRMWLNDDLYDESKYMLMTPAGSYREYEWTFTDEDFENAEEI